MENERRPSLERILTIDTPAFAALMFPALGWPLALGLLLLDWGRPALPALMGAATILCSATLVWRVALLRRLFGEGLEAPAAILQTGFVRRSGWVEYTFSCLGEQFTATNWINQVEATSALRPGQQVTAVFHQSNPRRAHLKELYCDEQPAGG